jgi:aldehyde:ferredoxin oxidoreductase
MKPIQGGWHQRIARIDLTTGKTDEIRPEDAVLDRFVGGRGLGGYYLRPSATLPWDHPDMPLVFMTGPLVGTPSPVSGRMAVVSRSPLTGTVADCSVGGGFGTALKKAGFDGLIITGKSRGLRGLEIVDRKIALVPADRYAGAGISTITAAMKSKGSVAAVGPAAENGVRYAGILIDNHYAAGRAGLGTVMAAKNLKYITVSGNGQPRVADRDALSSAKKDIFRLVSASPILAGTFGLSKFGTGALYDLMDARRMMPTNNFLASRFDGAQQMNAHAYQQAYKPVDTGCRGCHIRCKKTTRDGIPLPEFETMSHFSALLGNRSLEGVMTANSICNEMGMDTISAAVTLACHAELEGHRLTPETIAERLRDTALGRGIGQDLGKGAAWLARQHGKPETAMAVKGMELSAYDPRGACGMALAFAVSNRGACHLRAYPISHEILRKPVATDRLSFDGKARIIKIGEDMHAVADALTACKFIFFAASLEEYARVFHAVTGLPTTAHDLLAVGERIVYQERIINAANGFTSLDDDLPERFFQAEDDTPPPAINRKAFLAARANYYRVRGLDSNGCPTPEKTAALNLEATAP